MNANQIDVKKVKMNGNRLDASYWYDQKEINVKGKEPFHDDLRKAMNALKPYFVEICEQSEAKDIDWNNLDGTKTSEACIKFGVSGVAISGSGSTESVVISVFKPLKTNKTLFFTTPRVIISEENDDRYERYEDLKQLLQVICFEAEDYIINHKYSEFKLPELPFKEDDDDPYSENE